MPGARYGDANENGNDIGIGTSAEKRRRAQLRKASARNFVAPTSPHHGFVFKAFTRESLANIQKRKAKKSSTAGAPSTAANAATSANATTTGATVVANSATAPSLDPSKSKPAPDPYLASGQQLPPAFVRQLPAELVGKPIEDIDPYYADQETFVIISRGKELTRFSATKAICLLGPLHPIRRVVLYILVNPLFNLLVIMTILVNCILMTFQGSDTVEKTEVIFTIIYTTEMGLKVFARGFIMDEFTYLRDPWNWLDFAVIIMAYMTIVIEDLGNLSVIRTLRVLRALKTVAIIPGMKTIVGAVIDSVKNLKDVVVLTLFSLSVFSLLGLQIYMGLLTQKCILNGPSNMTDTEWYNWCNNSSHWVPEPDDEIFGAYRLCGNSTGAQSCPADHTCILGFGPNPDYGYTNFDTFGWALICSFRLMTQDFWEGLYMQILKTAGSWHIFFFIVSIFLGSIYLMNLILAIVAMSYNELQRRAEEEEMAAAEDEAAFLESCRLMEIQEQASDVGSYSTVAPSSYRPSVEIGLVGQSLLASLCQNGLLGQHVREKLNQQIMLPGTGYNNVRSHSLSVNYDNRNAGGAGCPTSGVDGGGGGALSCRDSNKRASVSTNYQYNSGGGGGPNTNEPMAGASSMTELRRKSSVFRGGSPTHSPYVPGTARSSIASGHQSRRSVSREPYQPDSTLQQQQQQHQSPRSQSAQRSSSAHRRHHASSGVLMTPTRGGGAGGGSTATGAAATSGGSGSADLEVGGSSRLSATGSNDQQSLVGQTGAQSGRSARSSTTSDRELSILRKRAALIRIVSDDYSNRSDGFALTNVVDKPEGDTLGKDKRPRNSEVSEESNASTDNCQYGAETDLSSRLSVYQPTSSSSSGGSVTTSRRRSESKLSSPSGGRRHHRLSSGAGTATSELQRQQHEYQQDADHQHHQEEEEEEEEEEEAGRSWGALGSRFRSEVAICQQPMSNVKKPAAFETPAATAGGASKSNVAAKLLRLATSGRVGKRRSQFSEQNSESNEHSITSHKSCIEQPTQSPLTVRSTLGAGPSGRTLSHSNLLSVGGGSGAGGIGGAGSQRQQLLLPGSGQPEHHLHQAQSSKMHHLSVENFQQFGALRPPQMQPGRSLQPVASDCIGGPGGARDRSGSVRSQDSPVHSETSDVFQESQLHHRHQQHRQSQVTSHGGYFSSRHGSRGHINPATMARSSFARPRPSIAMGGAGPGGGGEARQTVAGARRMSQDFVRRASDWSRLSMSTNVDLRRLLRLWSHTNPYQGRPSIGSFSNYSQAGYHQGSQQGSPAHSIGGGGGGGGADHYMATSQNNSPRPSSVGSSARQAYELISAFSRHNNQYQSDHRFPIPYDDNLDTMSVNMRDKCIAYCLSCLDIICIWECCGAWLRIQRIISLVVFDPFTDLFIIFCILTNTLFMALDSDDADEQMKKIFETGNYFFTATFAVEASMKIMALSPKFYFREGWNVFDSIIVGLSLLELGLEGVYGLSVLRSFRLLRVFKLAKSWPTLNLLISIMGKAVGDLGNLTFVLAIIVFIFAVMGMQLFSNKYVAHNFPSGELPRWNFTDFMHSFMIVFRILCAEWIEPMWDCLLVGGWPCIPFFLIAVVVGNLVVLNLFLALLLASFGASNLSSPQSDNVDTKKLQEAIARFSRFGRWLRRRASRLFFWLTSCLFGKHRRRGKRGAGHRGGGSSNCRSSNSTEGSDEQGGIGGGGGVGTSIRAGKSHIAAMSRLERLKNIELRTEELKSKIKRSPEHHYHLRQLAQLQAKESVHGNNPAITVSGCNYNFPNKARNYSFRIPNRDGSASQCDQLDGTEASLSEHHHLMRIAGSKASEDSIFIGQGGPMPMIPIIVNEASEGDEASNSERRNSVIFDSPTVCLNASMSQEISEFNENHGSIAELYSQASSAAQHKHEHEQQQQQQLSEPEALLAAANEQFQIQQQYQQQQQQISKSLTCPSSPGGRHLASYKINMQPIEEDLRDAESSSSIGSSINKLDASGSVGGRARAQASSLDKLAKDEFSSAATSNRWKACQLMVTSRSIASHLSQLSLAHREEELAQREHLIKKQQQQQLEERQQQQQQHFGSTEYVEVGDTSGCSESGGGDDEHDDGEDHDEISSDECDRRQQRRHRAKVKGSSSLSRAQKQHLRAAPEASSPPPQQAALTTELATPSGGGGDEENPSEQNKPKSSLYLKAPKRQEMEEEDEKALQHIETYIEKCICFGIICLKWFLFRQYVRKIVEHKYFDQCILVLIVISSGTLALEDKHLNERPTLKRTLDVLDTIFTIIFSLEMIFKWLAFGMKRYFGNIWSWLDFVIVLVSFVNLMASIFGSGKIQALKTMRTLRAMRGLRPLRALQRFQGMRVVVNALIQAIPSIFNVLLVCLIFWLIFSIMGVQMFGGKFWRCQDPTTRKVVGFEEAANKNECLARNLTWSNPQINFDNVLNAYLALFQVATFKGWIDIMNSATDSRTRDDQPIREANIYMYFYFVFFVIFGSFFTLNLFIGVIIDNFNEQKKKTGGSLEIFMTDDQKKYYHAMKKMRSKRPVKAMTRPKFKFQAYMFDITTSKKFDLAIMIIIGLNMFVMALEHYGQSQEFSLILENLNLIFIAIFTLECLCKIFAMRHFYFREPWNIFDFIVVDLSILGVVMKEYVAKYFVSPTLLRVVRVVKVGRVLRLVKGAKGIRTLLFALAMSLPALFNICLLLFLVMFIYAIFGMSFFMNVRPRAGIDETFNFDTFASSIIVLFQMSTSAAWDMVLDPLMDEENDCQKPDPAQGTEGTCGNKGIAIFYLVSYVIVTFLIIINMYIAVILENYSQATEDVQEGLTDDDYEMYYEIWQKFDPDGTQYLPYEKLSDFVDALEDPLRIPKPNNLALVVLDINIYERNQCYCVDILDALTKYFFERKGLVIQVNEHLQQVQSTLHETPFERITTTYLLKRQHYCAVLIQNCWRRWKEKAQVAPNNTRRKGSIGGQVNNQQATNKEQSAITNC